jgi:hypothetical protein
MAMLINIGDQPITFSVVDDNWLIIVEKWTARTMTGGTSSKLVKL